MTSQQPRQRRRSFTENVVEAIQKAEKSIEDALVVVWDDLPAWQRDNHYITSGYRPQSNSFRKSWASLAYLHNESVNILSHLIPGIGFVITAIVLYTAIVPRYDYITPGDVRAFGCFFAGAAFCLGMSATYHTISNHSHTIARLGNKLDYVGIVFLITGSFIPSIFYGFYCHPHLQETYWTMVGWIILVSVLCPATY
jgi:adiponectin receptor